MTSSLIFAGLVVGTVLAGCLTPFGKGSWQNRTGLALTLLVGLSASLTAWHSLGTESQDLKLLALASLLACYGLAVLESRRWRRQIMLKKKQRRDQAQSEARQLAEAQTMGGWEDRRMKG